jgi:hypothetical protein
MQYKQSDTFEDIKMQEVTLLLGNGSVNAFPTRCLAAIGRDKHTDG